MKLPNGYGSVFKVKGNRRKPWRARATIGFELTEESVTQKYVELGYFETKQKAMNALAEYSQNKNSAIAYTVTFEEMFEIWYKSKQDVISDSYRRSVFSAFSYCDSIKKKKFGLITSMDLKKCIDNASKMEKAKDGTFYKKEASANMKSKIKSLFNSIYDFAVLSNYTNSNYARNFSIARAKREKTKIPFTTDEIKIIWQNHTNSYILDMMLIQLYSGLRPSELVYLKLSNIHLDSQKMIGGNKTSAGIDREIPIHEEIVPIIEKYVLAARTGQKYLFRCEDGQCSKELTYDKYYKRFRKECNRLHFQEHAPHDCRHTFISACKRAKIHDAVIKRIVGHEIHDVTEDSYTHRTFEEYVEMINTISY